jgi:hypothetical protein
MQHAAVWQQQLHSKQNQHQLTSKFTCQPQHQLVLFPDALRCTMQAPKSVAGNYMASATLQHARPLTAQASAQLMTVIVMAPAMGLPRKKGPSGLRLSRFCWNWYTL